MALGSLFPKLALTIPLLGSGVSLRAGRKIDSLPEAVRPTINNAWKINALRSKIGFVQGTTWGRRIDLWGSEQGRSGSLWHSTEFVVQHQRL
jgi:hypothetical protein